MAINIREEGGASKIRNDSTTKPIATGYRFPTYQYTLSMLFWYLSLRILTRIVVKGEGGSMELRCPHRYHTGMLHFCLLGSEV